MRLREVSGDGCGEEWVQPFGVRRFEAASDITADPAEPIQCGGWVAAGFVRPSSKMGLPVWAWMQLDL